MIRVALMAWQQGFGLCVHRFDSCTRSQFELEC